jgi:hypothetical protein
MHPETSRDGDRTTPEAGAEPSVPLAVVDAIAAVTGRHPLDLPPLADSVDPDALAAVVGRSPPPGVDASPSVSFRHAGVAVTVSCDAVDARPCVER